MRIVLFLLWSVWTCGICAQTFAMERKDFGSDLYLSIEGRGFFQVLLPTGYIGYTRMGNFIVDDKGQMATESGLPLDPLITFPLNTHQIDISPEGTVSAFIDTENKPEVQGTIQLAILSGISSLIPLGNQIYRVPPDAQEVFIETPGIHGVGLLKQGTWDARIPTVGKRFGTRYDLILNIQGNGYFKVRLPNDELAYTRHGNFTIGTHGELMLGGGILLPEITIPIDTRKIEVSHQGTVQGFIGDQNLPDTLGFIPLAQFPEGTELTWQENNLYVPASLSSPSEMVILGRESSTRLEQCTQVDCQEYTPLQRAAERGQVEVVRAWLQTDVELNTSNDYGETALHRAAYAGHTEVVRLLLDGGADFRLKDNEGETALHRAARRDHLPIIHLLLEAGADPQVPSIRQETLLHWMVAWQEHTIVKQLLKRGVDLEAKDRAGNTALLWAIQYEHWNLFQLLLENGANFHVKNKAGERALLQAAQVGSFEMAHVLLERGANIEARDEWGETPLYAAVDNGHVDVVRLLLESGAQLNIKNSWLETPLYRAVSSGYLKMVRLLLQKGAQLTRKPELLEPLQIDTSLGFHIYSGGGSELHYAAFEGDLDALKILIDHGADPTRHDLKGDTALDVARKRGHLEIIQWLSQQ